MKYRNFDIAPAYIGFSWAHEDYDGAPLHSLDDHAADSRAGWSETVEQAKADIDEWYWADYEARVSALESEGLTRSDAQAVVDAELLQSEARAPK